MTKKEIILIDDKPYGLRQIEKAIPADKRGGYKLIHCATFSAYQAEITKKAFVVLLDFFLDADQLYGSQVASQVQADYIIGFSSMLVASEAIIATVTEEHAKNDINDAPGLFAVQKLKTSDDNPDLAAVFEQIL